MSAPALDSARVRASASARDWLALLKPRIMLLIVITTLGAMALAADGLPDTAVLIATVAGMCMFSGGASALNHWYDRDIDALMERTRTRPIPSGRIAPAGAFWLGIVLGVAGCLLLGLLVNWLAAALAASGYVGYALIYTVWLKRSTAQNIVLGGAAGAVPPLVGWAAVTGGVDAAAVALFAIVFLWTPPHFWALALLIADDYERAGVPMLPNTAGPRATARQIVLYTVLLVASSLAPVALGELGWIYGLLALGLGARFGQLALVLLRAPSDRVAARRVFLYSLVYLAALFAAMALDRVLLA